MDRDLEPVTNPLGEYVQQLVEIKEEVVPEQQEWSPGLAQEEPPEPPHIEEEQEELWTRQEREQLQGLDEADITKFLFTPVHVKSEDDEEKPQSSQLHQRQTEVSEHNKRFTTGEKPLRCSGCGKQFSSNGDLNRHMKIHTGNKPFSCSTCAKTFKRKEHLKAHMTVHTGERRFSCSVCGKSILYKAHLDVHMKIHTGEKPFTCSVCGKGFSRKTHENSHMRIHTGEKPFSCSVCGKQFARKEHMTEHMVVHMGEKPYSCSVCDKRFTRFNSVKKHKCVSPQSLELHQRQTEENREAEHRASCSTEQLNLQIKEEQEECWTGQEGEQLQGLEEADITKFPFTPIPVKSEDDEEKPQPSQLHQNQDEHIEPTPDGEDCGEPEPARNSHLEPHLQPETEDQPEDSSETDNSDDWENTTEYESSVNNGKRPFRFSECGKRLGRKLILKRHTRIRKPCSCPVCGKGFTQSGHLTRHMAVHTGEQKFSCPECGKRFNMSENLKIHMRIHTGEKPFCCSVCGKGFIRQETLRRHTVVHTGEKPYSCSVCEKKFSWQSTLKRHNCYSRQLSQLHHTQTEQIGRGADGEDCGGPEPARNPHPDQHVQLETETSNKDLLMLNSQ